MIDGHNRYGICNKHNIKFKTVEYDFDSKDDACIWIIDNQNGRRNLPQFVKVELGLKKSEHLANKGKNNLSVNAENTHSKRFENDRSHFVNIPFQKSENPYLQSEASKTKVEPVNTVKTIAKDTGTSVDTVAKVKKIVEKAPEEIKQKLRTGDISINQAHKVVSMVQNDDKKDEILKKAIEKIEELRCPRLKSWE
ncbi:MAG TPA: hypothetical protein VGK06_04165 [Methanosarcina sp.]